MSKLRPYRLFWAVTLIVLLLDQATKLAVQWMRHNTPEAFFNSMDGLMSLVYVRNTGAAWGSLSGTGPYLGVLALGALLAIYLLRRPLQIHKPLMQVAFGLLVAGIAGNMFDRLILGYVVDFIQLEFITFPAFNIADAGISVGVVMYVLLGSYEDSQNKKAAQEEQPDKESNVSTKEA